MAENNSTGPPIFIPPPPGSGPGPLGIPGGTDRSYQVDIIVCAVLTAVIGAVFVGLRFYARRIVVNVLGWEDWLILTSLIFSMGMCAGFIHEATLGHGTHWWSISFEDLQAMSKAGWYCILFYELSLWTSQASIMLLYIRIWKFPGVRRAAYALLALVMIYNILVIAMVATACIPLRAFWDFELMQTSYCHHKNVWWANTYMHIIVDFLIYLLPMPVIFKVRFQRRQKVLLFVLFAFGFFICLISIIRLYMLILTANSTDFTFDNITIAIWSCVETNGTIVIACFMTFNPLLTKWFPGLVKPEGHGASPQNINGIIMPSTGRVPTIGSGPSRPLQAEQERPWMFMGPGPDGDREKEWNETQTHVTAADRA